MLGKENSKENKLNEYFRRRCSNYERFLCDRVWECALCAKQAGKVKTLELPTIQRQTSFSRDLSTRSQYYFLQLWQRGLLLMTPLVVTHSVQRCFRQELHSRVCSWQTTPPHSSQTA